MDVYRGDPDAQERARVPGQARWSDETLERVLEAARLAPSARNAPGMAVRRGARPDHARADRGGGGAAAVHRPSAVVLLACCAETDGRIMRCGQAAYPIDVAIAMDHLTLAAAAEGLGTCWIGSFDEEMVKESARHSARGPRGPAHAAGISRRPAARAQSRGSPSGRFCHWRKGGARANAEARDQQGS